MADPIIDPLLGKLERGVVDDGVTQVTERVRAIDPDRYRTLAEASKEAVLFSHGPLFTYAGLDARFDPVADFIAHCGVQVDAAIHDFARPLFAGMATNIMQEAWDRRLVFVDRAHWEALSRQLANVATVNRIAGTYFRARPQIVRIIDQLASDRDGIPPDGRVPMAHITVFGVSGNRANVRFTDARPVPDGLAQVRLDPIDLTLVAEARRVLAQNADPFGC